MVLCQLCGAEICAECFKGVTSLWAHAVAVDVCAAHCCPKCSHVWSLGKGRSRVISLPMIVCQRCVDLFVLCRLCVWHWAALHLPATRVWLAILSQTNPGRRVVQGPQNFQKKPSALSCHRSATARERPTSVQLGLGKAVGSAPVVQ